MNPSLLNVSCKSFFLYLVFLTVLTCSAPRTAALPAATILTTDDDKNLANVISPLPKSLAKNLLGDFARTPFGYLPPWTQPQNATYQIK